jgi:hypothetical protein
VALETWTYNTVVCSGLHALDGQATSVDVLQPVLSSTPQAAALQQLAREVALRLGVCL